MTSTRRHNGEGSICKVSENKWIAKISLGTSPDGKPVLPSNFERSFHTVLKKAGIGGDYGIHALRHTFASMLFTKGVDVKIVSKILGHSSVKITYDIYVHLFDKDVSRVTMVLD